MKIKIDKHDLQLIALTVKDLFREIDPREGELTYDQFLGKCYLMACAKVLKVEVEYPNRQPVEPVDS